MMMVNKQRFMTARQAASALGISPATLYSYVSRGMLRSESVAGEPRIRHYATEDVRRIAERKEFRKNPAKAAAGGLHWGSPVLESSLTLINQGRLFYRGSDAIELAQHTTLEEVASLLWTGDSSRAAELFTKESLKLPQETFALFNKNSDLGLIGRCQQLLLLAGGSDLSALSLTPGGIAKTGARILRLLFSAVCCASVSTPLDAALARKWMPKRILAAGAIRAALILCADHELNVSAFTARCIASAQATPYEVVVGALAAFSGRRHGRASEDVEDLLREAEKTRQYRQLLARQLRKFGYIPGFGHPLYPDGDPRGRILISLAETQGRKSASAVAQGLIHAAQGLTGEHPNLDFGLVTLTRAFALPSEAPTALFALGRTIGWIAHAIEQYADNQLIRPRANYVGPAPTSL
jgi:citrate synthase